MTKTIDTLVEDIYKLFTFDPIDMDEAEVDKHIDTFGEMLKTHVKDFMNETPRDRRGLRLSAIGKPNRQLWYDSRVETTEDHIQPSTRIKFLYGYILEELLLLCATVSGHTVTDQQRELTLEGVKGHQDSLIDGVLIDCKSASGRSFDKFKRNDLVNDDPFGYIAQISAYAEANGLSEAGFLVIDKSTGEICLSKVHSMEMINASERIKELKEVVEPSSAIPDRCYSAVPDGKSGNMRLPIGCVYCRHNRECWQDANQGQGLRTFKYASGKRHLVQVNKTPDVEEVAY